MADLDVRRRSRPIWPWLVGAAAVALLVWAMLSEAGREERVAVLPDSLVEAPEADGTTPGEPFVGAAVTPALERYVERCARDGSDPRPEPEHTANCIRGLTSAIGSVVVQDTVGRLELQATLDTLDLASRRLEALDWSTAEAVELVRGSFRSLAVVIGEIQRTRHSNDAELGAAAEAAERAADAVRPERPAAEQEEARDTFFRRAAEALRLLDDRTPAR